MSHVVTMWADFFSSVPKVSDEVVTEFLGLKYAENLKAAVLWRVEYRALLTSISIYAGLPFESAPLSHPAVAALRLQRLWEQRPRAGRVATPSRPGSPSHWHRQQQPQAEYAVSVRARVTVCHWQCAPALAGEGAEALMACRPLSLPRPGP